MSTDAIGTMTNKKGMVYDKKIIKYALKNPNSIFRTISNKYGSYTDIAEPDKKLAHKLIDRDFDGIYDSYQLTKFEGNDNEVRILYNDREFDGTFDDIIYEHTDKDGNIISAVDKNANNEIDYCEHPKN